eukprot:gene2644-1642_t
MQAIQAKNTKQPNNQECHLKQTIAAYPTYQHSRMQITINFNPCKSNSQPRVAKLTPAKPTPANKPALTGDKYTTHPTTSCHYLKVKLKHTSTPAQTSMPNQHIPQLNIAHSYLAHQSLQHAHTPYERLTNPAVKPQLTYLTIHFKVTNHSQPMRKDRNTNCPQTGATYLICPKFQTQSQYRKLQLTNNQCHAVNTHKTHTHNAKTRKVKSTPQPKCITTRREYSLHNQNTPKQHAYMKYTPQQINNHIQNNRTKKHANEAFPNGKNIQFFKHTSLPTTIQNVFCIASKTHPSPPNHTSQHINLIFNTLENEPTTRLHHDKYLAHVNNLNHCKHYPQNSLNYKWISALHHPSNLHINTALPEKLSANHKPTSLPMHNKPTNPAAYEITAYKHSSTLILLINNKTISPDQSHHANLFRSTLTSLINHSASIQPKQPKIPTQIITSANLTYIHNNKPSKIHNLQYPSQPFTDSINPRSSLNKKNSHYYTEYINTIFKPSDPSNPLPSKPSQAPAVNTHKNNQPLTMPTIEAKKPTTYHTNYTIHSTPQKTQLQNVKSPRTYVSYAIADNSTNLQ